MSLSEVMVDSGKSQDQEIKFASPSVIVTLVFDTARQYSQWQSWLQKDAHTKMKTNTKQ